MKKTKYIFLQFIFFILIIINFGSPSVLAVEFITKRQFDEQRNVIDYYYFLSISDLFEKYDKEATDSKRRVYINAIIAKQVFEDDMLRKEARFMEGYKIYENVIIKIPDQEGDLFCDTADGRLYIDYDNLPLDGSINENLPTISDIHEFVSNLYTINNRVYMIEVISRAEQGSQLPIIKFYSEIEQPVVADTRLFITTEPPKATVRFINSNLAFLSGMEIEPALYQIEVSAEDYESKVEWVDIIAGQNTRKNIELTRTGPEPGRLFITTSPRNARVRFLDIKPQYEDGMQLSPGTYRVEVLADGYQTRTESATVTAGKKKRLNIELVRAKPSTGRLFVTTNPRNARVRLPDIVPLYDDGMQLSPGTYRIVVSADGYQTKNESATVTAGKEKRLNIELVRAEPSTGRLFVTTSPRNARVRLLNIKPRYEDGMQLSPGTYSVEVSADGYQTRTESATITAGQEKHLNIELVRVSPGTGILSLTTKPGNANVEVVGKGKYKPRMKLPSGNYLVNFSKKGYVSGKRYVKIVGGEISTLDIMLTQQGRLFVKKEPANANVRFRVSTYLTFSQGMYLAPASYEIEVSADAYRSEVQVVDINPGRDTTLHFKLTRLGRLYLDTTPLDARARFADRNLTYSRGMELDIGSYDITVSADGYETKKRRIDIKPGDKRISVKLKRMTNSTVGSLIVETVPKYARVRIVGPRVMVYQEGMQLSPGYYRIEVSLNGYVSKTESVTIELSKLTTVRIALTPKKTTLTVISKPEKASVCINKADKITFFSCYYSGKTPYSIEDIQAGRYSVFIKKIGYETYTKDIQISFSEEKEIFVELERKDMHGGEGASGSGSGGDRAGD